MSSVKIILLLSISKQGKNGQKKPVFKASTPREKNASTKSQRSFAQWYNYVMNKTQIYIFDCDGVITDLYSFQPNMQVIERISSLIDRDETVGFITGRSTSWIKKNVLAPLGKAVLNKQNLEKIYFACEFGGRTITFENGEEIIGQNHESDIPRELRKETLEVFSSYKDSMWHEEKDTLLTFVVNSGFPIDKYHELQKTLIAAFEKILASTPGYKDFVINTDSVAVNIRHKSATKDKAVMRFISFLGSRANVEKAIVFGDSQSDTEMVEALQDKYEVDFVFVGKKEELDASKIKANIIYTEAKYDQGTLEYLDSI